MLRSNQKLSSDFLEPRKLSSEVLGEGSEILAPEADAKPAFPADRSDPPEAKANDPPTDNSPVRTLPQDNPLRIDQKKTLNLIQPSLQSGKSIDAIQSPPENLAPIIITNDSNKGKVALKPWDIEASTEQPLHISQTGSDSTQRIPPPPRNPPPPINPPPPRNPPPPTSGGLSNLTPNISGYQPAPPTREPLNLHKLDRPPVAEQKMQEPANPADPPFTVKLSQTGPNILKTTGLFRLQSQSKQEAPSRQDTNPGNSDKLQTTAEKDAPFKVRVPIQDEDLTTENNKKAGIILTRSASGLNYNLQSGKPDIQKEAVQAPIPLNNPLLTEQPNLTQKYSPSPVLVRPPPPPTSISSKPPAPYGSVNFQKTLSAGNEGERGVANRNNSAQEFQQKYEDQTQNKSKIQSSVGTRENSLTRNRGMGHSDAYKPLSKDLNTHRRDKDNSLVYSREQIAQNSSASTQPPVNIQQMISTKSSAATNLENHFKSPALPQGTSNTETYNQGTQSSNPLPFGLQESNQPKPRQILDDVIFVRDTSFLNKKTEPMADQSDNGSIKQSPNSSRNKVNILKLKDSPLKLKVDDLSKTVFNPKTDKLKNIENSGKFTPLSKSLIEDTSKQNSSANTPSKAADNRIENRELPSNVPAGFNNTTGKAISERPSPSGTPGIMWNTYSYSKDTTTQNIYSGQSYYLDAGSKADQKSPISGYMNKTVDPSSGSKDQANLNLSSPSAGQTFQRIDLDSSLTRNPIPEYKPIMQETIRVGSGGGYLNSSQTNPLKSATPFGQPLAMKQMAPLRELLAPTPNFGASLTVQPAENRYGYSQDVFNLKQDGGSGAGASELRVSNSNQERSKSQKVSRFERYVLSDQDKPKITNQPEAPSNQTRLILNQNPRSYGVSSYAADTNPTFMVSSGNLPSAISTQGKPASYTSSFEQANPTAMPAQVEVKIPQPTSNFEKGLAYGKKSNSPKSKYPSFTSRFSEPPEASKNANRFQNELLNSTNNQQNNVKLAYLPTGSTIPKSEFISSTTSTLRAADQPTFGQAYPQGNTTYSTKPLLSSTTSTNKENDLAVSYTQQYIAANNFVPGHYGASVSQSGGSSSKPDRPALSQPQVQAEFKGSHTAEFQTTTYLSKTPSVQTPSISLQAASQSTQATNQPIYLSQTNQTQQTPITFKSDKTNRFEGSFLGDLKAQSFKIESIAQPTTSYATQKPITISSGKGSI